MATARREGDSRDDLRSTRHRLPPEPVATGPDVAGIIAAFERHRVAYIVVGGHAAAFAGARRTDADLDCVVDHDRTNLSRLARALTDVGARLRVTGLDDSRSRSLNLPILAESLSRLDLSTWRTDMGTLDVLAYATNAGGQRLDYHALAGRARETPVAGAMVLAAPVDTLGMDTGPA